MTQKHVVVSLSAQSEKLMAPNVYTMTFVTEFRAPTKDKARQALVNFVEEKLAPVLSSLTGVVDGSLSKVPRYQDVQSYNKKTQTYEVVEYSASYTVSFKSTDVEKVSHLYEQLSKLDNTQVRSVNFGLTKVAHLEEELLGSALETVKSRLAMECKVMGLDADKLEVVSWSNNFSHREATRSQPKAVRAMASLSMEAYASGGGREPDLTIEPSDIHCSVHLEVSYGFKS
ncbi:MAG: SIMPL domain-containing protein [Chitinophagales bacterium]|nr:SIMPL domain-containing protein [Chitinophagales bacterium]